jgi:hypothetical protein
MTLNSPPILYTFHNNIMSKSLYISLLRKGNTGNEILSILDTFVNDEVSYTVVESHDLLDKVAQAISPIIAPTLEPIQF